MPTNYKELLSLTREKQNKNLRLRNPKGIMSAKAQKRIRNAINWLALSVPSKKIYNKATKKTFTFQLSLVTLTLTDKQVHSDNEIKKNVLQPFIDYMRKAWLVNNYIWKAETQANGNIHFHIVIDSFIHHKAINSVWNKMLSRLNYKSHKASTRIESIKKINDIGAYMAKYLSKNDKSRRMVEGKIWACSESLSEKNTKCTYDSVTGRNDFQAMYNDKATKQKELIIYNKNDTNKERGYYVGDLILYKWKTLLTKATNELLDMITTIKNKIYPQSLPLRYEYLPT